MPLSRLNFVVFLFLPIAILFSLLFMDDLDMIIDTGMLSNKLGYKTNTKELIPSNTLSKSKQNELIKLKFIFSSSFDVFQNFIDSKNDYSLVKDQKAQPLIQLTRNFSNIKNSEEEKTVHKNVDSKYRRRLRHSGIFTNEITLSEILVKKFRKSRFFGLDDDLKSGKRAGEVLESEQTSGFGSVDRRKNVKNNFSDNIKSEMRDMTADKTNFDFPKTLNNCLLDKLNKYDSINFFTNYESSSFEALILMREPANNSTFNRFILRRYELSYTRFFQFLSSNCFRNVLNQIHSKNILGSFFPDAQNEVTQNLSVTDSVYSDDQFLHTFNKELKLLCSKNEHFKSNSKQYCISQYRKFKNNITEERFISYGIALWEIKYDQTPKLYKFEPGDLQCFHNEQIEFLAFIEHRYIIYILKNDLYQFRIVEMITQNDKILLKKFLNGPKIEMSLKLNKFFNDQRVTWITNVMKSNDSHFDDRETKSHCQIFCQISQSLNDENLSKNQDRLWTFKYNLIELSNISFSETKTIYQFNDSFKELSQIFGHNKFEPSSLWENAITNQSSHLVHVITPFIVTLDYGFCSNSSQSCLETKISVHRIRIINIEKQKVFHHLALSSDALRLALVDNERKILVLYRKSNIQKSFNTDKNLNQTSNFNESNFENRNDSRQSARLSEDYWQFSLSFSIPQMFKDLDILNIKMISFNKLKSFTCQENISSEFQTFNTHFFQTTSNNSLNKLDDTEQINLLGQDLNLKRNSYFIVIFMSRGVTIVVDISNHRRYNEPDSSPINTLVATTNSHLTNYNSENHIFSNIGSESRREYVHEDVDSNDVSIDNHLIDLLMNQEFYLGIFTLSILLLCTICCQRIRFTFLQREVSFNNRNNNNNGENENTNRDNILRRNQSHLRRTNIRSNSYSDNSNGNINNNENQNIRRNKENIPCTNISDIKSIQNDMSISNIKSKFVSKSLQPNIRLISNNKVFGFQTSKNSTIYQSAVEYSNTNNKNLTSPIFENHHNTSINYTYII